jgi:hypothetical protein
MLKIEILGYKNYAHQFGVLLTSQRKYVMGFIPQTERSGINNNNSVLYQSLGTHQFVIRCIVNNINNTGLLCATYNKIFSFYFKKS